MTIRLWLFLVLITSVTPVWAQDIAGATDHPLIGRYDGSFIKGYDFQDFDAFGFAETAGVEGFRNVEGKVTRIAYILPVGVSLAAAARNFQTALADGGFATVFECETKTCGETSYDLDQFPIPKMIIDRFNYRILSAVQKRAEGDVYAQIVLSVDASKQVRVQAGVVETAPLEIRMIDAAQMQNELLENGRVALYGIQFDSASATIRSESEPTLAEIAAFLGDAPKLTVVIVGHTDNQGSLEYNLGLSQRRARAVRDALVAKYGISADRMLFAGAGFLAPVAPNTTADGQALNRRVEIIAR